MDAGHLLETTDKPRRRQCMWSGPTAHIEKGSRKRPEEECQCLPILPGGCPWSEAAEYPSIWRAHPAHPAPVPRYRLESTPLTGLCPMQRGSPFPHFARRARPYQKAAHLRAGPHSVFLERQVQRQLHHPPTLPILIRRRRARRRRLRLHPKNRAAKPVPNPAAIIHGTNTILPTTPPFPSSSCASRAPASGNRRAMIGWIFFCCRSFNSVAKSRRNNSGETRFSVWML
jgi:hypothetical protein